MPALLPAQRCALTAPFHPYPHVNKYGEAVYSLWRFPSKTPLLRPLAGRYPAPCLHGARTFLARLRRPRPSDRLAKNDVASY